MEEYIENEFTLSTNDLTCVRCGATVRGIGIKKHDDFHAEIAELIEWAQGMSDLYRRPNSAGKILGPNPGLEI